MKKFFGKLFPDGEKIRSSEPKKPNPFLNILPFKKDFRFCLPTIKFFCRFVNKRVFSLMKTILLNLSNQKN